MRKAADPGTLSPSIFFLVGLIVVLSALFFTGALRIALLAVEFWCALFLFSRARIPLRFYEGTFAALRSNDTLRIVGSLLVVMLLVCGLTRSALSVHEYSSTEVALSELTAILSGDIFSVSQECLNTVRDYPLLLLLSPVSLVIGSHVTMVISQTLCALISAALFFGLANRRLRNDAAAMGCTIAFLASPPIFSLLSSRPSPIFLGILGCLAIVLKGDRSRFWHWLGVLSTLFVGRVGATFLLLAALILKQERADPRYVRRVALTGLAWFVFYDLSLSALFFNAAPESRFFFDRFSPSAIPIDLLSLLSSGGSLLHSWGRVALFSVNTVSTLLLPFSLLLFLPIGLPLGRIVPALLMLPILAQMAAAPSSRLANSSALTLPISLFLLCCAPRAISRVGALLASRSPSITTREWKLTLAIAISLLSLRFISTELGRHGSPSVPSAISVSAKDGDNLFLTQLERATKTPDTLIVAPRALTAVFASGSAVMSTESAAQHLLSLQRSGFHRILFVQNKELESIEELRAARIILSVLIPAVSTSVGEFTFSQLNLR